MKIILTRNQVGRLRCAIEAAILFESSLIEAHTGVRSKKTANTRTVRYSKVLIGCYQRIDAKLAGYLTTTPPGGEGAGR